MSFSGATCRRPLQVVNVSNHHLGTKQPLGLGSALRLGVGDRAHLSFLFFWPIVLVSQVAARHTAIV